MAYEKHTWTTGEVITAGKLNNMEDGIASAGGVMAVGFQEDGITLNKTWQEIYDAMNGGTICIISYDDEARHIIISRATTDYIGESEEESYVVKVNFDTDNIYAYTDSASGYPRCDLG